MVELRPALDAEAKEVFERRAHVDNIVFIALHRQAFNGGPSEVGHGVHNTVHGEEGGNVQLAQAVEGGDRRLGKDGVGYGGGERKFVNGGTDGRHDTLSADPVEVFIFVVAAAYIEDLEVA